jgi:methylthioribose-1-phosphate isomerase
MNVAQPIEWTSKGVVMLDQRRLPGEVIRHTYTDYREVAAAIKDMVIRGAPAIGVAAAMGVALGVERSKAPARPRNFAPNFPTSARRSRKRGRRPWTSSGPSSA